jgi:hypothetical protein
LGRADEFDPFLAGRLPGGGHGGQPGIRFVTATELKQLYADTAAQHRFTRDEVVRLAQGIRSGITFQQVDGVAVSAAEAFSLLNKEAAVYVKNGTLAESVTIDYLDGPARTFVPSGRGAPPATIPWSAFAETAADVAAYCRSRSSEG